MSKEDIDASEAPLIEHLIELRTRLIWCALGFVAAFIVSFFFSSDILHYLVLPFKWGTGQDVSLISIKLLGVFLVKLRELEGRVVGLVQVFDQLGEPLLNVDIVPGFHH